ncbi:hypothetical protein OE766_09815 [Pararhizobium sp. YC-54]|uniref:hypothetical protein n=1 Tax=Pararhizobium sp. YC-54 TaxID=2986920 RepID=UPI0021F6DF53|nr:hypothetical protein [Pararhizobium sp. YC-54]MCV9998544.1 hypothetical protein [Pararhizobium sp. YC-54]
MADFVAVIRRTVDGLSDNVPEMRAKVYDKARGAVRRQLESMKPRPSDEMIERQMIKLEAAINEVEDDHAEALPPLDEQQAGSAPEAAGAEDQVAEPAVLEADEPEEVDEPEAEELPEPAAEPEAAVEPAEQPDDHVAAAAPVEAAEPLVEEEHTGPEPETAAEAESAIFSEEDDAQAEPVHTIEPEQPEQDAVVSDEAEHPATVAFEPQETSEAAAEETAHVPDAVAEPAAVPHDEPAEEKPTEEKPAPAASTEWELPEWNDPVPATAHSEPVWTEAAEAAPVVDEIPDLTQYEPVETVTPLSADAGGKDQAPDEAAPAWAWDDSDPFTQAPAPSAGETAEPAIADWSWPIEKTTAAEPEQRTAANDSWNEIDELLAHGGAAAAAGAAAASQAGKASAAVDENVEVPARPVSYRVEPKRSRLNVKAIGLGAVLLLILGGGGYAYWQNQATVNSWVSGMLASITAKIPGQTTPEASVPEEGNKDLTAPETNNQTQTPANTEVAAVEGSSKFTQRLQQDGSEIDQGPAAAPAGANATEEGKSVAAQTEAGKPVDTAQATQTTSAGQTTNGTQPAQPVPGQQAAADPATQQVPAGAQKMFLYEERLGQSAPTAIEGNVAWSVKEESPGGDAKPEPVVQAQINVPERGLTALMTVKRNTDSSLPASHVIEFVFSLPENFEGGSIDNVQRVSMKRNEQDRGDALIAVPAKITEDFHMIALNDFPEAVATNTELLRTRSWIDIPLTYRNGRRALLTLEKGAAGTEAFTRAMQAWSLAAKPEPAGQ